MFQTPVAIFIFNRPHCTEQLIKALATVRPCKLFVVADGPRNTSDTVSCEQTRDIIDQIDWPCTILKRYSKENIGCRESIPNGLNWVFDQVETCIILEDDCIPQPSFFPFCEELLSLYKNDERIMTIGGHRSDGPNECEKESYYFSKYPSVWGWATWKKKWAKFDLNMDQWNALKDSNWLSTILPNVKAIEYWKRIFDKMKNGMNTWDYALAYSCWLHHGLSIRSKVNMISNVGFGEDATHTRQPELKGVYANPIDIKFPLIHPNLIRIDEAADDRIEWINFSGMDDRMLELAKDKILKLRLHDDS